jgi:transcriptional adapter 2-alpha
MQALDKKRPKEEKEIAHRLRPLAKTQTAEEYENFIEGILCECRFFFNLKSEVADLVHSV